MRFLHFPPPPPRIWWQKLSLQVAPARGPLNPTSCRTVAPPPSAFEVSVTIPGVCNPSSHGSFLRGGYSYRQLFPGKGLLPLGAVPDSDFYFYLFSLPFRVLFLEELGLFLTKPMCGRTKLSIVVPNLSWGVIFVLSCWFRSRFEQPCFRFSIVFEWFIEIRVWVFRYWCFLTWWMFFLSVWGCEFLFFWRKK